MSTNVVVVSCGPGKCPWHRVTDIGNMPLCKHPGAASERVARLGPGVPGQCPVKTMGPYLVYALGADGREVFESVKGMLEEWLATWTKVLDK